MRFESIEQIDPYESAFQKPDVIEVGNSQIEVVDLVPDDLKTETPLILIPGWLATAEVFKENAKLFANRGRRTLVLSAPHGVDVEKEAQDSDTPLAELKKAQSVMEVLEQKEIEKVDVVTHSEGALFVTAAALEYPERFRNIIYYAPAGLIGDDSFLRLIARFSADILKQIMERGKGEGRKSKIDTATIEAVKAIAKGPKKSLDEVRAIVEMQIQENLRELKAKGVGIVIVHPVGDKAFPMERMQNMVDSDMVDGFVSVGDPSGKGEIADTHNSFYLTPEKFTPAIDALLDSLERKSNKASVNE